MGAGCSSSVLADAPSSTHLPTKSGSTSQKILDLDEESEDEELPKHLRRLSPMKNKGADRAQHVPGSYRQRKEDLSSEEDESKKACEETPLRSSEKKVPLSERLKTVPPLPEMKLAKRPKRAKSESPEKKNLLSRENKHAKSVQNLASIQEEVPIIFAFKSTFFLKKFLLKISFK